MQSSAPGKIMLAGEYAVLEGGPAVVAAVARRVRAALVDAPPAPTPILRAIAAALAARDGEDSPTARAARSIAVDSSALQHGDGAKLGLGSSAAVASAAAACALAAGGRTPTTEEILALARSAHAAAQSERGVAGSGVDVIATAVGGVVLATRSGEYERLQIPDSLELVAAWTGQAADTVELVKQVNAGAHKDRAAYRSICDHIASSASDLGAACRKNDAGAAVVALSAGDDAIGELATLCDVPLVLPIHRKISELAAARGGAAKPTGAGGGDIALAGFADGDAACKFREDLVRLRIQTVEFAVDPDGATLG